jgi:hypothetical protein
MSSEADCAFEVTKASTDMNNVSDVTPFWSAQFCAAESSGTVDFITSTLFNIATTHQIGE